MEMLLLKVFCVDQWCSGRLDCQECERWYPISESLRLSHSFFSVGMTV